MVGAFTDATKMTHPSAVAAAFLSTGFISLLPNVLLFLFPNFGVINTNEAKKSQMKVMLSFGQSLAVGGLLGDVFLHTLPDCFAGASEHHDHNDHDNHQHHHHHHQGGLVGLIVIAGFATFMVLDICVRLLEEKFGGCNHHDHEQKNHNNNKTKGNDEKEKSNKSVKLFLSSSVLLNLLGDSLHNFTDGLAIGATYAASEAHHHESLFSLLKSRGGLATASVFFHEIPHELGDFATLLNAGFSRNMAIGAQFLTAIAAFLGTSFGLYSSQLIEGLGHDVLLPFTAGGFVYLSCCTIMPEVLDAPGGIQMRFFQLISFAVGVTLLYVAGQLEEEEHGFHSHHHHDEGEL